MHFGITWQLLQMAAFFLIHSSDTPVVDCHSNIADLYLSTGEKWSSYCLSSLTARNVCTSKIGSSWAQWDSASLSSSIGSSASCSFLHAPAVEESSQHLQAAARNPNQAIFTVDASTTEVFAAEPAAQSSP